MKAVTLAALSMASAFAQSSAGPRPVSESAGAALS
jgi:hypothetical protein